jgi:hypothetical protein
MLRASAHAARLSLAVLGLAVLVFAAHAAAAWPYVMDDAYITLRYSRNLVAGLGPNFDAGVRAEGYTTFLWMLLCTLPHVFHANVLLVAKAMGLLFMAVAVAGVFTLGRRLTPDDGPLPAALAVLFFTSYHASAIHAVSGMETALFAALFTWLLAAAMAFVAAPRGRRAWLLAAFSLLLGLTRPEGNLVAGVTLVTIFFSAGPEARRTLARAVIGAYVVPGAVYFTWRFAYYGHPFPLPFYIKVSQQGGPKGVQEVAAYLLQFGSRVLPFVVAGLVTSPWPWARPAWPAWAAVGAFLGFFLFPEHIMAVNDRYLFPSAVVLCAFTAPGTAALLNWALGAGYRGLALAVFVLAFSATAIVYDARQPVHLARAYAQGLEAAHVRLGKRLATLPTGTLAIADAGAVPYLSGWPTVDTFGLNDPYIATTRSHDPAYVLARRPDVIVLISSRRDAFDPHLEWERSLYDAALGVGFAVAGQLLVKESYFLWVLARPGTEAAAAVASLAAS